MHIIHLCTNNHILTPKHLQTHPQSPSHTHLICTYISTHPHRNIRSHSHTHEDTFTHRHSDTVTHSHTHSCSTRAFSLPLTCSTALSLLVGGRRKGKWEVEPHFPNCCQTGKNSQDPLSFLKLPSSSGGCTIQVRGGFTPLSCQPTCGLNISVSFSLQ